MINFEKFARYMRYTDKELQYMTLSGLTLAFTLAENIFTEEEFNKWTELMWTSINRVRSKPTVDDIDNIVRNLLVKKSVLIELYNDTKSEDFRQRLVEIDQDIDWICKQYDICPFTRYDGLTSGPYDETYK